jgi:hypothetical protein
VRQPSSLRTRRGRIAFRLSAVALALGITTCFGAALVSSCGSDAVGVDACRQIEAARCEAAQVCPMNTINLIECKNFYHDQCLHGIENSDVSDGGDGTDDPAIDQVTACVGAIQMLQGCIKAGEKTMAACNKALVLNTAYDPTIAAKTPCDVLEGEPEALEACSFVIPTDAGVTDAATSPDAFIL